MKILIVLTGGTIGSTEKNGVADVDKTTAVAIADICKGCGAEVNFAFPYNILSENATCETLSDICSFMLSVDYDSYSGIIVTHGSDTLAYTANLLAAALSWVSVPVVLTAANYVMTDRRSNASDNLRAACALIRSLSDSGCGGVYCAWKNDGEPAQIHLASRLLEADAPRGKFESYGGAVLGTLENGRFKLSEGETLPQRNGALGFLKTAGYRSGRALRSFTAMSDSTMIPYI